MARKPQPSPRFSLSPATFLVVVIVDISITITKLKPSSWSSSPSPNNNPHHWVLLPPDLVVLRPTVVVLLLLFIEILNLVVSGEFEREWWWLTVSLCVGSGLPMIRCRVEVRAAESSCSDGRDSLIVHRGREEGGSIRTLSLAIQSH